MIWFFHHSYTTHILIIHSWITNFDGFTCFKIWSVILFYTQTFHFISYQQMVQYKVNICFTSNRNMPWPSTSYSNSSISIYDFDESEISTSISSFSYMKMTFQSLSYQHLILLYTCIHHSSVFHEPYHLQTSIIYQIIKCIL